MAQQKDKHWEFVLQSAFNYIFSQFKWIIHTASIKIIYLPSNHKKAGFLLGSRINLNMEDPALLEKQNYLHSQIIEKNYDPESFINFLA